MSLFRDKFLVKLVWVYVFFLLSNILFDPFSPGPASGRYIDLLGRHRHLTLYLIERVAHFTEWDM